MKIISENKSFDGWVKRCEHESVSLNCTMIFSIYLPPIAKEKSVPVLYWLSGLTCNDENFMQKANAQRVASELGIAIVCPDTSPRGTNLPGEHDNYDFGSGAGFYLNATQAPWSEHYNMYDYIVDELPQIVTANFPITDKASISGHSMGGHGALTIALKNRNNYQSVSAFSPICNPTNCAWGERVFTAYLGEDRSSWAQYDATLLVQQGCDKLPILIDQGEADEFLREQLKPECLQAACEKAHYPLTLRMHAEYDHSYFFVASFIESHLRYHDKALKGEDKQAYY
jgi:S-formylglutathione hydrolase